MNKKKDHGKITLGMLKGKPVTTSVPSISIKFHANVEQIEELYMSEDEANTSADKIEKPPLLSSSPSNAGEADSSPLRYLPRLVKRSTSVDVSQGQLDASPPSDPWRFFSDIKGKITKSVEEKITDFKARNQEEGSPHHKQKADLKTIKDSKENSSVSDSEELSESSISKTCGIVSTTEGVEMSSDDDTPSLDKDKKEDKDVPSKSPTSAITQKFRLFKNKTLIKEGSVKVNDLSKLYNINTEKVDQALPEDSEDVENAVDALEDDNLKGGDGEKKKTVDKEDVLKSVSQKFDNIELDNEKGLTVREVTGKEIRSTFLEGGGLRTVFAPTGFVDLRPSPVKGHPFSSYMSVVVVFLSIALYLFIHYYSLFLAGLSIGVIVSYIFTKIYLKICPIGTKPTSPTMNTLLSSKIVEVQAIKEYQPLSKYEGWVNEYPNAYNPNTYHISQTQSVYLRLQGNLLRISHSKSKVPKRAMWNEPDIKMNFSHHRIYNLLGAKIGLLPEGLAKKRHWSKKYPICVALSKDQMNFEPEAIAKLDGDEDKGDKQKEDKQPAEKTTAQKEKKVFSRFRKREYPVLAQRFSKLTEDEEFELESDSRASTPSAEISDLPVEDSSSVLGEEDLVNTNDQNEEDFNSLPEDWSICSPPSRDSPTGAKIYIFGRTDREKEDWFRRLCAATHKGVGLGIAVGDLSPADLKETASGCVIEAAQTELEYLKYMSIFKPSKKQPTQTKEKEKTDPEKTAEPPKSDLMLWVNALIGRVLFDCMRNPSFTMKVRERIQRKLCTIKLPYFIEEILIPELSLGKTPPFIHKANKPVLDGRGLWIDLDVTYEGAIVLTLQTKLNLMRLKNPQAYEKSTSLEKSAIYNSDVDDSAESSSDEEGPQEIPNIPQEPGNIQGGSSNSGKKFIKMVDRLAESKIFQAATENRYIKKAMEGVSNTDLRLKVEVKAIMGTLVLNVPPPPSDRVWVGFRPVPEIVLSARPIVGERNISYIIVTSWIEKKLLQEFQKIMVIPNMEDFVIPVMNPKLPD
ncbi:testis-expressed protein 2-like isoform X2 [Anoplophora glabripennis]|uniref:testis-expressed protein 2 isoform X4 n=1 Tax=Anoplophora glabripennis TaxID=217634 RepID=UPI00087459D8|nr:testis-expressed protein 2 isoform X4 [Anoplophora glabripennis]XP_023311875.1 testis-expressed protein 2-like isoform X2 [Anoplophora glabripennis]XP_023311876.1 testis-expressed protein 2-like isoform X2 [Anoplophora glabripennis]